LTGRQLLTSSQRKSARASEAARVVAVVLTLLLFLLLSWLEVWGLGFVVVTVLLLFLSCAKRAAPRKVAPCTFGAEDPKNYEPFDHSPRPKPLESSLLYALSSSSSSYPDLETRGSGFKVQGFGFRVRVRGLESSQQSSCTSSSSSSSPALGFGVHNQMCTTKDLQVNCYG